MRALLDGEVTVEIDTRGGFHVLMAEPDLASADGGHTDRRIFALTSANVGSPTSSCGGEHLHFAVPGGGDRLLGSRNREVEATSRASAARSTSSARPKLWITVAVGTPASG